ncbi:MAG: hypothetical protein WBD53_15420 [Xanthobacteraceae bacterium]
MKKNGTSEQKKTSRKRNAKRTSVARRLTIGLAGFEKISAIEGLHLTRDMKATFGEFDRQGASPAQRRAAIIKRYG